jgi:RimJ/RimL family protein N-acetyltransferase
MGGAPHPDPAAAIRALHELSDGRLRLRRWRAEDASVVVDACRGGDIPLWCVGVPQPYGMAEARDFFDESARAFDAGERAWLAIADAATNEALGAIGLELRAERQAGEIGYWARHHTRRYGVVSGALKLMARWAFEEAGLARLELVIHVENEASQAVAARAGFRREGVLRAYLLHRGRRGDYWLYSRLPDDPVPAPPTG